MEVWKEFEHNEITHSAAHHLMAIDDLVARFGYARVSDIARTLHITRGSVSISLRPLKDAGLVLQDENRHVRLSPTGAQLVQAIKVKRGLVKRLLAEVLGVHPEQAEIDACKTEHLVSNDAARRIVSLLQFIDQQGPEARSFFRAWSASDPVCSHDPANCRSCSTATNGCVQECLPSQLPPASTPNKSPRALHVQRSR